MKYTIYCVACCQYKEVNDKESLYCDECWENILKWSKVLKPKRLNKKRHFIFR